MSSGQLKLPKPLAHAELTAEPGPIISTQVPTFEKLAKKSNWSLAATVIASEAEAGNKKHASPPLLPAATATRMPTACRDEMAWLTGSFTHSEPQ